MHAVQNYITLTRQSQRLAPPKKDLGRFGKFAVSRGMDDAISTPSPTA
jgi:hypothetical protein